MPLRKAFLDGNPISGWTFYGTPSNTGDGIIMAQEIGAGLLKPGKVAARLIIPTQKTVNGMRIGTITPAVGSPHSIVVDNFGNRYAAENLITKNPSAYFFYKEATKFDITNLTYPRSPSWMIFDETLRTSKPLVNLGISTVGFDLVEWDKKNEKPIESGLIIKADTIEALAEKIRMRRENANRMDAETLVRTVETFNKACDLKKMKPWGVCQTRSARSKRDLSMRLKLSRAAPTPRAVSIRTATAACSLGTAKSFRGFLLSVKSLPFTKMSIRAAAISPNASSSAVTVANWPRNSPKRRRNAALSGL